LDLVGISILDCDKTCIAVDIASLGFIAARLVIGVVFSCVDLWSHIDVLRNLPAYTS